jgi:molybdenum cofactor cytidylyltransferase
MAETWAIILAAGESTRMKTNKLLLQVNGITMIETVIRNVMQPEVDHILVVLGAFRANMIPVISTLPVLHCYNAEYKKGMLSSVQCGFRNIPDAADTVLVYPGDQPRIPGDLAGTLCRACRQSGKGIVVPVFSGKRGHPLLITGKYRQAVGLLSHDEGLRSLLRMFPGDVLEVEVEVPGILLDIDTPDDYKCLTQSK